MDDRERLAGYVEVWWDAVQEFTTLLDALALEDWSRPTDLPGWDVFACAAHTAHLEAILAGAPEETVDVGQPDHVTSPMGLYTEQGVVARRGRTPAEVVAELRDAAATRHERLLADPPTDGRARPTPIFGGVPWDWETLLRNRPLDVWMHTQDVRRAVGRPDGLDGPAADHVTGYLAQSLGYVLAKRAGAAPGTTLVLRLDDGCSWAFSVDEAGRGIALDAAPADPTVGLAMDRESFVLLAGGRRAPEPGRVRVSGDDNLGRLVLARLAVTP